MRAIANWFFLIAMSFWLGSILFFSFVLTPTLKAKLGEEQALQAVMAVLPVYFQLGIAVGAIVVLVAVFRTLRTDHPKQMLKWLTLSLLIMLTLNIAGYYLLIPVMQDFAPEFTAEAFTQYYNLAQGISLVNLLLGLQALLFLAIDMRVLPGRASQVGYTLRF